MKHWRLNLMMGVLLALTLTLLCVAMPAVASGQPPGDTLSMTSLDAALDDGLLVAVATQTTAADLAITATSLPDLASVVKAEKTGNATTLAAVASGTGSNEGRLLLRQGGIRS